MYHSAKLWGQRGQQGKDRGDYQSDRIKKFTDFKIAGISYVLILIIKKKT